MAPPVYTYQIADLRTNSILQQVRLSGVTFTKPLNDSGRLDATWKLGAGTAHLDPYDLTMPCRRCIYVWRDDRPMWGGIIWTRKYNSATQTVKLGAGEFWSYFDHRKILPVLAPSPGLYTVAALATTYTATNQNAIARQLVQLAQTHTGGDIQIQVDTTVSGQPRDRTYPGSKLSTTGEALRQLAGVIDGQDLVFDVGPNPAGGAPRRLLLQGTPVLGQQGSSHVWTVGGNVTAYNWDSDGTRMATRAYAVGEGVDLGTPIAVAEDTTAYTRSWPLLEQDTAYDGNNETNLTGHAQADQQAARTPALAITLVVRGDIPPTAAQISRGDDGQLIIPRGADPFHRHGLTTTGIRLITINYAPSASAERVVLTAAPLLDTLA